MQALTQPHEQSQDEPVAASEDIISPALAREINAAARHSVSNSKEARITIGENIQEWCKYGDNPDLDALRMAANIGHEAMSRVLCGCVAQRPTYAAIAAAMGLPTWIRLTAPIDAFDVALELGDLATVDYFELIHGKNIPTESDELNPTRLTRFRLWLTDLGDCWINW